ncbi:MAG: tRNA epoxyqueuosine(34) reductase QueG [Armatimonadetes bacterium]|nr:tRNA epoxyqueuosine(34) reductase QueG [Armatimonadota bacterium]
MADVALPSGGLKGQAIEEGFELAGVCPAVEPPHLDAYLAWLALERHGKMTYMSRSRRQRSGPQSLLPGAKSILAVGLNYNQEPPNPPNDPNERRGRVSRYAVGRDYHKVMRGKLKRIARWAEREYAGLKSRPCVDSAPILERDFAWLAGLGWYGKNTCLINTKRGSWFFIGLLLLDREFEPDEPAVGDCGTCTKCIDACPTGALVYEEGNRVAVLDSNLCISYLTIEHPGALTAKQQRLLNGWVFGCDVCQDVCPFNRPRPHQPLRAAPTREPDFAPRPANVMPRLTWLAGLGDEQFVDAYRGSALMRAGPERMRRNALGLLRQSPR